MVKETERRVEITWLDGIVKRSETFENPRLALQRLGEVKFAPSGTVRERISRRLVKLHGWNTVAPVLLPGAACDVLGLRPEFTVLSDNRSVFSGVRA